MSSWGARGSVSIATSAHGLHTHGLHAHGLHAHVAASVRGRRWWTHGHAHVVADIPHAHVGRTTVHLLLRVLLLLLGVVLLPLVDGVLDTL